MRRKAAVRMMRGTSKEGNRRSSKECASARRRVGRSSMVGARTTCAVKLKMEGWIMKGDGNKLICYWE